MRDSIKNFIEQYIELLEDKNFEEFYKKAETVLYFSQDIGTLTSYLLDAGIDPLEGLKSIPYCYLYGNYKINYFEVPNNVEFIESEAFANCTALEKVVLGTNVSVLYYGCFEGCLNLKEVILNDGLLEIGQYVFRHTDIEKITIPATVRDIDVQAFMYAENITLEVFPNSYAHHWAIQNGFNYELVY